MKSGKEAEGVKARRSTLEASVTLGDQCATFQQAPNLRALNQTHFLSHMESAREAYINGKPSAIEECYWLLTPIFSFKCAIKCILFIYYQ